MRHRPLGSSGLIVSVAGLGCNNFGRRLDVAATRAVVDAAIDAGVTLLDTADTYGGAGRSEEILGEVLAGRRDQVVLATKFGNQGADMGYGPAAGAKGGRAYIRHAVEQSLRRLRTDHIDLYQLHTPDPRTPVEETLSALGELVAEGKVRYIGHSNFAGWQVAAAAGVARELGTAPFVSAQNHWSLLERAAEEEVVPACEHFQLGVLPYFPLANGLLTGKVRRAPGAGAGHPAALAGTTTSPRQSWTRSRPWPSGRSSAAGLCWRSRSAGWPRCLAAPRSPPGPPRPEQVRANAAASDWVPEADELAEIDKIVPLPEVLLQGTTPSPPSPPRRLWPKGR